MRCSDRLGPAIAQLRAAAAERDNKLWGGTGVVGADLPCAWHDLRSGGSISTMVSPIVRRWRADAAP